jgi:hypothetical protein
MLEPEVAALDDGAVDHLGVFLEPSLVLLRTRPGLFRLPTRSLNQTRGRLELENKEDRTEGEESALSLQPQRKGRPD